MVENEDKLDETLFGLERTFDLVESDLFETLKYKRNGLKPSEDIDVDDVDISNLVVKMLKISSYVADLKKTHDRNENDNENELKREEVDNDDKNNEKRTTEDHENEDEENLKDNDSHDENIVNIDSEIEEEEEEEASRSGINSKLEIEIMNLRQDLFDQSAMNLELKEKCLELNESIRRLQEEMKEKDETYKKTESEYIIANQESTALIGLLGHQVEHFKNLVEERNKQSIFHQVEMQELIANQNMISKKQKEKHQHCILL